MSLDIRLGSFHGAIAGVLLGFNFMISASSAPAADVGRKIVELHENIEVDGLEFSPDGRTLAATSTVSGEVHLWKWQERRQTKILYKEKGSAGLYFEPLKFTPDGRYLAACHSRAAKNVVVRIWDMATASVAQDIDEPLGGSCSAIAFTPDRKLMVRIRSLFWNQGGNSFIVYDTGTWEELWGLRLLPFYGNTVALSPDGKFAAVGGRVGGPGLRPRTVIEVLDLQRRAVVKTIEAFPENTTLSASAWSPDGTHIAAGIWVHPDEEGELVRIFDAASGEKVAGEPGTHRHSRIYAIRYSPDGKYLAESAIGGSIRIWDGRHRDLLQEIRGEAESLAFSSDGQFLAMGGDRKILIWKLK